MAGEVASTRDHGSGADEEGLTTLTNDTERLRTPGRAEALWLTLVPVVCRITLAIACAIVSLFVFIKIAHGLNAADTRHLDTAVLHFFRTHQSPLFHTVMTGISWLAGPVPQAVLLLLAVLGFLLARRFLPDGLTLLVAGVGGAGLMVGLKRLFHRPRPEDLFAHLGYSFPSGHSFFALVIYGMLAYRLTRDLSPGRRRWMWCLAVLGILLVGFSRVFLGEHYPSDVAAGFAVAVPWLWGCLALPSAFGQRQAALAPEEARRRYEYGRERLREAARFIPNMAKLVTTLARDRRVPISRKLGLALLAGYLAMPFDLIPDFIPVLGAMDDIFLTSVVLGWVAQAVPQEVLREHWDGSTDLFALLDQVRDGMRGLLLRG